MFTKFWRVKNQSGYMMFTTLFFVSVFALLLSTFSTVTRVDLATLRSSSNYEKAFFTAEASLNLRADEFRKKFLSFEQPSGSAPSSVDPCIGSNLGTGDLACKNYTFDSHNTVTYVEGDPSSSVQVTIPLGEAFAGLSATEFRYDVFSKSLNSDGSVGALLGLRFKSRIVPIFQFAAFYNKDLEISPAGSLDIDGPVHTNNNLYIDANTVVTVNGQVTVGGDIYRGYKLHGLCRSGTIQVVNNGPLDVIEPEDLTPFSVSSAYDCDCWNSYSCRANLSNESFSEWNGMILQQVQEIETPEASELDPVSTATVFSIADLRLALLLDQYGNVDTTNSTSGIEVRDSDNNFDSVTTNLINACPGNIFGYAIDTTNTFYNHRENSFTRILEIDVQSLLDCLHNNSIVALDDNSSDGLIFHATVDGPNSFVGPNNYGVRLSNGSELASTVVTAPDINGLTIVSDQSIFVAGDYNSVNKKPAAIMTDALNVLSNNWDMSGSNYDFYSSPSNNVSTNFGNGCSGSWEFSNNNYKWNDRVATSTTINAAVLSGTPVTGGAEGVAGHDQSPYSGGLQNFPRLHERWNTSSSTTLSINGSFVSLSASRYSFGNQSNGCPQYYAPSVRDYAYDSDFNNPDNLPPATFSFVYLKQVLFSRDFEQ